TRAILASLAPHGITSLDAAVAALQAGDPVVRDVVVAAGRELGSAIAWLIGVLNIERLVLVGSATEFGEPWLAAVREAMAGAALGLLAQATTVEIGRLGDDGVVLGASALLMTRELGLSLGQVVELEAGDGAAAEVPGGAAAERGAA
ncbi:MAG TPA: ROK family protein, partial [Candidatus Limnocylindrales bacterium]